MGGKEMERRGMKGNVLYKMDEVTVLQLVQLVFSIIHGVVELDWGFHKHWF